MINRSRPNTKRNGATGSRKLWLWAGVGFLLAGFLTGAMWWSDPRKTQPEVVIREPVMGQNANTGRVTPAMSSEPTETPDVPAPDAEQVAQARMRGRQMIQSRSTTVTAQAPAFATPNGGGNKDNPTAQRLGLLPLPEMQSSDGVRDLKRLQRMEELRTQAAEQTEPNAKAKLLLTLAAYHAGDDDWKEVGELYSQIRKAAVGADVKTTISRNMPVVEKNLEIQAAPDQAASERLQLELSALHQSLGHEKAARGILRNLALKAGTPSVQQEAKLRYEQILKSGGPPQAPSRSPLRR